MPQDYNKTLNLPVTEFPMRAGLPQREPEFLKKWYDEDLYGEILKENKNKPSYILHDGPPYANGDIHIGHALNKILKDFIVRYKNMSGFRAPYVPGWDTHGLPIENQAIKKVGINRASVGVLEFRKHCKDFAEKYVANQREQFKRLGVIGDWEKPYLTLAPEFEAKQIEVFGEMAKKGYIYKGLKPVYWCAHDETALAEAEIEYAEDPCTSIYVKFKVTDDKNKLTALCGKSIDNIYFVIWTTTTWTLPGNVAICVGPRYKYSLVECKGDVLVVASELVESVMKAAKCEDFKILGEILGSELELMTAAHPFLDRQSLVIVGDHVTLETGTGCVHTAPGHGVDDFIVCLNYKQLPIVVPVDNKGRMTAEAGSKFEGLTTEKANEAILEDLKETNSLLATDKIIHQYPHCWRCKNPILFRATEQWFCSVEDFREKAIAACREVEWVPAWGEERIVSMVRDRNDWCISRQRVWGVPIPVFYCEDCGKYIVNDETIKTVSEKFKIDGSDAWYKYSATELLPDGFACECGSKNFRKETDIMDVWFDSGSSHKAVLETREDLRWPSDMYLEGNDQYRGWFQSSLLTSVAINEKAPYKTVLTHGFVVDSEGKKMSKSIGNVIDPLEVIKEYGADILRLWVASSDYRVDIRISKDILKQLSEVYRKIRNTARFILGNINDFVPDKDMLPYSELTDIDKWALFKLNNLIEKVEKAYNEYEYHLIYHSIHNFCVVDMSNFYLDIIKDRLYCEKTESKERRAAQTAMYIILDALVRMLAPVLCFTAEEMWQFMPHTGDVKKKSISFNELVKSNKEYAGFALNDTFERLLSIREDVKKALELARTAKVIGASLEAKVALYCNDSHFEFLKQNEEFLSTAFIVSNVSLLKGEAADGFKGDTEGLSIQVSKADGEKCERCWVYSEAVGTNTEHPTLCNRCANVV